jgi:hypothetical protein
MKPIGSYPTFNDMTHDNGLKAAADGEHKPDSWAAYGNNGGMSGTLATYAFAICSGSGINISGTTTTVHWAEASGPTVATTGQTKTVGCGSDGNLLSGGASVSNASVPTTDFTVPASQGDHLNGSYPSDVSGNPVIGRPPPTPAEWPRRAPSPTCGRSAATTACDPGFLGDQVPGLGIARLTSEQAHLQTRMHNGRFGLTANETAAEVDSVNAVESVGVNTALSEWVPRARVTVRDAVPPVTVTGAPRGVVPSMNWTLPTPAGVTVAARVSAIPGVAGEVGVTPNVVVVAAGWVNT